MKWSGIKGLRQNSENSSSLNNFLKTNKNKIKAVAGATILGAAALYLLNECQPGNTLGHSSREQSSINLPTISIDYILDSSRGSDRFNQANDETGNDEAIDEIETFEDYTISEEDRAPVYEVSEEIIRDESEPIPEDAIERNNIENLEDLLETFHQRDGSINARLMFYEAGTVQERDIDNLTLSNIKELTHFFEGSATFYDNGDMETENPILSNVRNLTIPTSYGDLELYNFGNEGIDESKNFFLQFSNLIEIIEGTDGRVIRRNVSDYVDQSGLPYGVRAIADAEDNVQLYQESHDIDDRMIEKTELYTDLVDNQEKGHRNYLLFPEYGGGMIASIPENMESLVLGALDVLYGNPDRTERRLDVTSIERNDNRYLPLPVMPEPIDPPREPVEPIVPTEPEYEGRFHPDSDRGAGDLPNNNPRDTQYTRPERAPRELIERHRETDRTSNTPVRSGDAEYSRPVIGRDR